MVCTFRVLREPLIHSLQNTGQRDQRARWVQEQCGWADLGKMLPFSVAWEKDHCIGGWSHCKCVNSQSLLDKEAPS